MKGSLKRICLLVLLVVGVLLLSLALMHLGQLVLLFKKLLLFMFAKFQLFVSSQIGYLSTFVVLVGTGFLILRRIWANHYLQTCIRDQGNFIKPFYKIIKTYITARFKNPGLWVAIILIVTGVWLTKSFDVVVGFLICASLLIWLILKYRDQANGLVTVSIVIILFSLAPFILIGQNTHVKIFDELDAWFPQQKILAQSGEAFSFNPGTKIDNIMNGLPISGFFNSGFYAITILLMIFDPFVAYTINKFIMAFTAFFGMFLLLKRFFLEKEEYRWIVIGSALCFSLLPFYSPSGLSIAGLPFLFYCFLKLKKYEGKAKHFAFILLFPFYSVLSHAGLFILISLGFIFLYDIIKEKKINVYYFSGLLILCCGYILTHFHLIFSFLNPNFVSYREEIKVIPLNTKICWHQSIENFIHDRTHSHSAQSVFLLISVAVAILIGIFRKIKEINKSIFFVLLIFLTSLLWGFQYWEGIAPVRVKFQLLNALNLARFYWLNPVFWYILFALSLVIILKVKMGRHLVMILLSAQILFLFTNYNWEYRHLLGKKNPISSSLSYGEFYSESLFKEIETFINRPQRTYRIVCIGMHPGVANYNGFYTLDLFSNIYPLEYKHRFRRIIAKELDKNQKLKITFDDNGKRCYILPDELNKKRVRIGMVFSRGITKKQGWIKIKNLQLNTTALKEMGGEYIFSAVKILNFRDNGLFFERVFEDSNSPWRIYLYKVL